MGDASAVGFVGAGFSHDVNTKFPDASTEIMEAQTCYALGRHTASVFHLMRAVEHGLRALVVAVGVTPGKVPLAYEEWNTLIEQLEKAWKAIEGGPPQGWGKSAELTHAREFFNPIVADLHAIKDAVRNVTMHTRGSYDEESALAIRNKVADWFRVLATKVEQQSKPASLLDRALFSA
jgi:hypothetical protein